MISEKQLQANRQNAQKSTGPRSAEGKAASSQNALRHGLLSCRVVLSGEDPALFESFSSELFAQFDPADTLESHLVEHAVVALWELRRLGGLESQLLDTLRSRWLEKRSVNQRTQKQTDRIARQAKTELESLVQQQQIPPHRVSLRQALDDWYDTAEGRAWCEDQWPSNSSWTDPVEVFLSFWDKFDLQLAEETMPCTQEHLSHRIADQTSVKQKSARADLSYQVMQEQQSSMTSNSKPVQSEMSSQEVPPDFDNSTQIQSPAGHQQQFGLGSALVDDFIGSNVLLKFSRYHTQTERTLYRVLNELNRLQSNRKRNESIEVPAVESDGKECA